MKENRLECEWASFIQGEREEEKTRPDIGKNKWRKGEKKESGVGGQREVCGNGGGGGGSYVGEGRKEVQTRMRTKKGR